jgi:hypothetical protein
MSNGVHHRVPEVGQFRDVATHRVKDLNHEGHKGARWKPELG